MTEWYGRGGGLGDFVATILLATRLCRAWERRGIPKKIAKQDFSERGGAGVKTKRLPRADACEVCPRKNKYSKKDLHSKDFLGDEGRRGRRFQRGSHVYVETRDWRLVSTSARGGMTQRMREDTLVCAVRKLGMREAPPPLSPSREGARYSLQSV